MTTRQPADNHPTPATDTPITGAQQMARELMNSLPDLKSQLLANADTLRQDVAKQVKQHMAAELHGVQQSLQGVSSALMNMPGTQRMQIAGLLEQLQERLSLPETVDMVRQAGLDQPLDFITLTQMGFTSEQELLSAGLPADSLPLLRAACQLHTQTPVHCSDDYNCMPHAIMLGFVYEALVNSCLHPLFVRTNIRRGNGLSSFDVVDWRKCEAFAACDAFCSPDMKRLTPADWAVWLNLMACCRMLRNRQHSNQDDTGFISRAESDALFALMFLPGQMHKLNLLSLSCFGPCPPAWSKRFEPRIPAEWSDPPCTDPCECLKAHIRRQTMAFTPSLLQLLLRCGDLLPDAHSAI